VHGRQQDRWGSGPVGGFLGGSLGGRASDSCGFHRCELGRFAGLVHDAEPTWRSALISWPLRTSLDVLAKARLTVITDTTEEVTPDTDLKALSA
jgi:hypothetical protein